MEGMTPYTLHHGDCLAILRTLPDASVDAVVTDPPYGLSFMGKRWDYDVPSVEVWAECIRVLKPGGHLLAFAGTRTQHRMAVRIEDAGFDIRDLIAWVYGSGFPKSLDVSKAIDREAGAEREVVGQKHVTNAAQGKGLGHGDLVGGKVKAGFIDITAPATPAARAWQGWGTALKPALEPITVARKPLDGTVAENVLAHGTGALNVDGCRVGTETVRTQHTVKRDGSGPGWHPVATGESTEHSGRWPANLIHDGSEEVVGLFPETNGGAFPAVQNSLGTGRSHSGWQGNVSPARDMADSGSAARFFYCAKAAKADRDAGCEGLEAKQGCADYRPNDDGTNGLQSRLHGASTKGGNHHPTVKPTDLMRYLCRLVTPPGGVVLDPFTGSGSTGRGAILEGFRFVGIERESDYLAIARARIDDAVAMRAREAAQGSLGL